ncbi:MAG: hypothetical protein HY040_08685 [Planctomycetes bacterium]|nr:hypothetical protein [Planctomycetota bacterium]
MEEFIDKHSGELLILLLFIIVVVTLVIVVPQLLRAHLRKMEMIHLEHMRAIENGQDVPVEDDRARVAGRAAMLVPMVVVITAGTVTCFLATSKLETITSNLFAVCLAVWVVSGVVSLAAITGGVALIGRLAQLHTNGDENEVPENPLVK